MKKLLALVLSLVMLCSVFAVASAENGEKITIRVTWWGEVSENDAEMMMIEKFNAEHDDIKIVPEVVPGDGYGDRLLTSFASGEGPDIFASGEGDFYKWVGASMPLSLNDLIANDTEWTNEMNESIYNFGNIGGNQYYMVRDYNPLCLFYNKDVFDKYGVAYPTDDWTWDDAIEAAKKLTVKNEDGTYACFGFNAQSWEYAALTYLASKGLDIVNEDCTEVDGYLNSPEMAAALSEYVGFSVGDDRISPDAADQDTFGSTSAMLINGNLAMTISGAWDKATLEEAGVNYGTALVPGNHENYMCASAFAISSSCKNPEAAWEVLKALTGAECSELRAQYTAALPTSDALLEEMKADYGEANMGILDSLEYCIQPVGLRGALGNPAVAAFKTAFERIQFNDGTVEDILNDAVAEVHEAMAE